MCSFAKSPAAKIYKKPQHHPELPEKAARQTPQYLSAHSKAAYQTHKYFQLPKQNYGNNCLTEQQFFHTFMDEGGPSPPLGGSSVPPKKYN